MYVLLFSIFRVVSRHILSRITRASRSTRTCTSQEPRPRTGDLRYHVPQTYDTVTKLTVVCHQRSKAPVLVVRRSTLDAQPETGYGATIQYFPVQRPRPDVSVVSIRKVMTCFREQEQLRNDVESTL